MTLGPPRHADAALVGRRAECARVDRLLAAARAGQSAVLVLRGEAGIGKTALLGYAAKRAEGCRVIRAVGVESEMELPFAGLHQLCASLLDGLDRLPAPQRGALGTAFGLSLGAPPDRFLVGLAVLTLLSDAAEERPLACLIDDAQWLDRSSAQVLAFVARRVEAESVVLLFAERDVGESDEMARLPEVRLQGLSEAEARDLLATVMGGRMDERVRDRIVAETRGNPLALLELPQELLPPKLAGGFGILDNLHLPGRIEVSFQRRVQQLPAETQRLLLVAAAEPTGDPTVLWRAAAELGIPGDALAPAESDRLLELGARVAFRHPLLRSAVYGMASTEERREAHRALAAATDADVDPDRRAWHRAQATLAPDEAVAQELERSAGRAEVRGGLAAAGALLERAAALTPEPAHRARRGLQAAAAKQLAGAPQDALTILTNVGAGPLDDLDRAMLVRLRGQIALDLRRGADAVPLLLDAAQRLEPIDLSLARATYLEALRAASIAGRLGDGVLSAAEVARNAPPPAGAPRAIDLLLDGIVVRFTDGCAASVPALKPALTAVRAADGRPGTDGRPSHDGYWPWIARGVAPDLFDDEAWHDLVTRNVQIARDIGALGVLPIALTHLASVYCFEGDLDGAEGLLDESDAIVDATGNSPVPLFPARFLLAGCRGDEARLDELLEASEPTLIVRGEGAVLTWGEHARAVLHNGLGHYEAALAPAESACAQDDLCVSGWSLSELVEAAARSGRSHRAAEALASLSERTQAAGTDWALGIEARSRALLSTGTAAEELYREAVHRLGHCRIGLELARAHLLYGEWQRRARRRVDARENLHIADEMFTAMGARGFAERARRELMATGETARKRTVETRDELTAQEVQIARLARDGLSNVAIGAQLFISPRTVKYHLRKVFTKLEITSRNELNAALPDAARAVTAA